jgi:hypothetical protein
MNIDEVHFIYYIEELNDLCQNDIFKYDISLIVYLPKHDAMYVTIPNQCKHQD